MPELLSVNEIAFTVLGYPLSYVELAGTLCYLWSVWLMVRRRMWTWPVGIVSVLLYAALFYQIRLYSDALEQVYYLAASVYGWRRWCALRRAGAEEEAAAAGASRKAAGAVAVGFSSFKGVALGLAVTAVLSAALGALMSDVHVLAPALFPEEASFPFLDAATTVMSFTAMWLLARARAESWLYWIVVDTVGVWLYYVKGVRFVALLYVVLLALAAGGLASWLRAAREGPGRRR